MSNEIQISPSSNLPTPTPWSTALVSTRPPQQQSGLLKVHQLLRGRYGVAILLAAMFAAAGAAAGFLLPRPSYQSVGLIEIKPVTPTLDDWDRVMPMYQYYVSSVVQKIVSDRFITEAINDPRWKQHRPNTPTPAALAEFKQAISAKYVPGTTLIQVTYSSDAKDAKLICQDAVQSLIKAYDTNYVDDHESDYQLVEGVYKRKITDDNAKIAQTQEELAKLTKNVGEDPQTMITTLYHEMAGVETKMQEAEGTLTDARIELKKARDYRVEELARVDPVLATTIAQRATLENQLGDLMTRLGAAHPQVRELRQRIDNVNQQVNQIVRDDNANYFIKQRPDASGGVLIPKDLSTLQTAYDEKKKNLDQYQEQIERLQSISTQLATNRKHLQDLQDDLAQNRKQLEKQENIHEIAKSFTIVDQGGQATVGNDRRVAFSALGFLAGGGLPIGLMLLAGLMNPRVRYSDETSREVSGLTLLGILPDLPDRLSDPEQASIAAHCVHQIRTMLQINNHTQDRRVFALTSAAPGDGKTSLTLALGLSYAACGTRTLLIDCDLVGAGLTTRMNVNVPEGVLEAIANRSLLEYVRTTDVADVAILPVGTSNTLHASTLSPAALRRLVDEAKKHFETVLIDTGPILGSIEASLVCAAADAVVLCVSRGQQRPMVEKAIQHLTSIGARLAGVVFNRAQSSDFDRSISGLSVRSSSASGNGGRFGPVARAVQNSYKASSQE